MRWCWSCFHADNTNLEILILSHWHTSWIVRALRQHKEKKQQRILSDRMPTQFVESVPGQTCPFHVEGQTFPSHLKQIRELETAFVHCVPVHAGNLKFRFQHGPFPKRFRPMVTRVPAIVLSISRFSRLAATRARIFALNKLTTEGAGTYSHFSPRPLRMSWLTYCCCIAVIACGIGLFRMARASSRLTSVQINTTKHFWVWGLAACLPPRRALTYA